MVTLKDIAKEVGVGITTVSNVVHNRASRVSPELAARHLLENGHRVIAFASPFLRENGVVEKRLQGYQRALGEFGIPFDPQLVFEQEISIDDGVRLGRALAGQKHITGIFASADILAAGIVAGLCEEGVSVPQDKSIVGFDDNYLCRLTHPQLTTIHQDAEQKGVLATKMLLGQLRHQPTDERQIILPVRLVERESVRNIKGD